MFENINMDMSDFDDCLMIDNYQHISPAIMYTAVNIPGPGANLEDFNTQFKKGCDCKTKCTIDVCPCVKKYNINYDEDGKLLESKFNGPVVECNSLCGCAEKGRCGNRIVQFGPRENLIIFDTGELKGFGLKSESEISKGEFICEYAGEIVSLEKAYQRSEVNSDGMNYILILNEYLSEGNVLKTCVDPTVIGNIGRYINHSCQPNSTIIPVRTNNLVPKLCIFALRVIRANEEISFDYGGGDNNSTNLKSDKRKSCSCGSSNCKKVLPYDETIF
ncbi:hypothetical protein L9F63_001829 [Diploptera punctata]|uniref:Histone-lysine N-methyltransferase SETMAR n=1 Tax=Diploptera punctata TaxID=6984 RepID=A0AAD8A3T9_DIPPU|nr:hypothetical protein L9F63_001829 [Diploptera punctata]